MSNPDAIHKFVCQWGDDCNASFDFLPDLKDHIDDAHLKNIKVYTDRILDQDNNLTSEKSYLVCAWRNDTNITEEPKTDGVQTSVCGYRAHQKKHTATMPDAVRLLKAHICSHMNYKSFACFVCGQTFARRTTLLKHFQRQKEVTIDQMQINNEISDNTENNKNLNPNLDLQCEICKKVYPTPELKRNHIYNQHKANRKHKCEVCGACFRVPAELKRHILYKHTNERNYSCQFPGCQLTFKTERDVIAHEYLQHDYLSHRESTFSCDKCSYQSRSLASIRNHMRLDHDENYEQIYRIQRFFGPEFSTPIKSTSKLSKLPKEARTPKKSMMNNTGSARIVKKTDQIIDPEQQKQSLLKTPPRVPLREKLFTSQTEHQVQSETNLNYRAPKTSRYLCHLCNMSFRQGRYLTNHFSKKHFLHFKNTRAIYRQDPKDGLFRLAQDKVQLEPIEDKSLDETKKQIEESQRIENESSTSAKFNTSYNSNSNSRRQNRLSLTKINHSKNITRKRQASGQNHNNNHTLETNNLQILNSNHSHNKYLESIAKKRIYFPGPDESVIHNKNMSNEFRFFRHPNSGNYLGQEVQMNYSKSAINLGSSIDSVVSNKNSKSILVNNVKRSVSFNLPNDKNEIANHENPRASLAADSCAEKIVQKLEMTHHIDLNEFNNEDANMDMVSSTKFEKTTKNDNGKNDDDFGTIYEQFQDEDTNVFGSEIGGDSLDYHSIFGLGPNGVGLKLEARTP